MTTRVALFGAGGRMGGVLAKMVIEADDLTLAGAYERSSHPDIGRDVGVISGLSVQKQVLSSLPDRIEADVVMDFSLPEGTAQLLRVLRGRPLPLICGTTGLSESIRDEVAMLAMRAPVVWSPNFSSGVNLLFHLVRRAVAGMGSDVEVEVEEIHHRNKKDSPSGTALRLVEEAALALKSDIDPVTIFGRQGEIGARPHHQIGVHALRGGDVVGEHTVFLFGNGERLELTHRTSGREALASGALKAARWVGAQQPGLYGMLDVLGIQP